MKKNGKGTEGSFGPLMGERVLWDTASSDHECDCPGPPPQFYLPPPPRPSSLVDSNCSKNLVPLIENCKAIPVIDAEYHYSPAISSLAIILTVAVVIMIFLLGTFLVALKKKKIQYWLPRKSWPQNRAVLPISANGVVYGDVTDIHPRLLASHCPPGLITLPSIEMIGDVSCPNRDKFSPIFKRPNSPAANPFNSQELFNPVYEELSNGSEERDETESEGTPQAAISEDEFAEDELSLGGELDIRMGPRSQQGNDSLRKSVGNDACKDTDLSDVDDKSKFLENCDKYSSLSPETWEKGKKQSQESSFRRTGKRPKSLNRRKLLRNRGPPLPTPPANCNEFHEMFLIKKILQIYPNVTGVGLEYSHDSVSALCEYPSAEGHHENFTTLSQTPFCRHTTEVFSTSGAMESCAKNQTQDSSLGSDSGYSNNTSGGKSSLKARKDCRLSNRIDPVLS